ncbi:MAG: AbrB family transcriptional regulator [Candidatus Riflebacteria bacterium]|nr:AbrB family transcriptional regulator [Candidatus Riflebacteria bacterium]
MCVAGLVTRSALASFARQWPIFLAVTLSTLFVSSALGWLLNRRRLLPGTTATRVPAGKWDWRKSTDADIHRGCNCPGR